MNLCKRCTCAIKEAVKEKTDGDVRLIGIYGDVPESDCEFWAHKALNEPEVVVRMDVAGLRWVLEHAVANHPDLKFVRFNAPRAIE